jgi:hypothetical protein
MPLVTVDNYADSAFVGPEIGAVAYAATPASASFDGSKHGYNVFEVATLTGAITIPAIANPVKGQLYHFFFVQNTAAGNAVTFSSDYVFPEGAWVTGGSATNGQRTSASFIYDGVKFRALTTNTWA